ncbi:hypothetical protein FRC01_011215, partial [Tulasnella sp. 417]
MKNEKNQSKRIQFALAALKQLKAAGLSTRWIVKPLQADINTLTTLGQSELESLVRVILGAGGMQAVEKHILKALNVESAPGRNMTAQVACYLQRSLALKGDSCLVSTEERPRTKRAISALLTNGVKGWNPFAIEWDEGSGAVSSVFPLAALLAPQEANPDVAINLLKAAIETKGTTSIETLLHKLMALPERGGHFEMSPNNAVRLIVFPTLKGIVEYLEGAPPNDSLSDVVRKLKRGLCQVLLEHRHLSCSDLPVIFKAVGGELDSTYVRDGLVSHFCTVPHDLALYEDVCRQLGIWKAESRDPNFQETVNESIKRLLQTATNDRKSQYIQSVASAETILKLCAEVGVVDFCDYIFSELAGEAELLCAKRSPEYILSYVEPFSQWLSEQGHGPLYSSFPELSRVIMATWRQKAMGPMPAGVRPLLSAVDEITCACEHCARVKSYLEELHPYEERLDQVGSAIIGHVEATTLPHCHAVLSWRALASKPEPSLWMRKSDETIQGLAWFGKQQAGLSALQKISEDEATLMQVLGEDEYRRLLAALHVDYVNAPLPASRVQRKQAASATTSRSTASTRSASANNERPTKRRK